jgi:hypothetical protein
MKLAFAGFLSRVKGHESGVCIDWLWDVAIVSKRPENLPLRRQSGQSGFGLAIKKNL